MGCLHPISRLLSHVMYKKKFFSFIALFLLIATGCTNELHERKEALKYNGVIVGDYDPIWTVAKDTAHRSNLSHLKPMPIIDDEIIVGSYKDGNPGFRRMKIETGEIIWEWYLNQNEFGEIGLFSGTISVTANKTYIITSDNRYMIFTWDPDIFDPYRKYYLALDITTGKEIWRKNIPSMGSLQVGYDKGDDYIYCSAYNVFSDDGNSKYINRNAYRVRIADGQVEEVFRRRKEPELCAVCDACPFTHDGKKYLFITESVLLDEEDHDNHTSEYGLIDRNTGDTLMWKDDGHEFISNQLTGIDVHNGVIYVFNSLGYSILNTKELAFTNKILLGKSSYELQNGKKVARTSDLLDCHYFYKDKLIVGMSFQTTHNELFPTHQQEPYWIYLPQGFLIDIATNMVLRNVHAAKHASIMDDILYYAEGHNLYAFDINTGEKKIDQFFSNYDCSGTSSVYKNAKGEKFVIVSNVDYTYCFPGL